MLRKIMAFVFALVLTLTALPEFDLTASAEMPYSIAVDLTNQIVTIYSNADGSIVRQMLCSSGKNDSTPTGEFTLPKSRRTNERAEWYYFYVFQTYAKYATRIYNGILFHSIPYTATRDSAISAKGLAEFGMPASHGCIRLLTEDAKFIAQNCLAGTKVLIYKSNKPDPELRELLYETSYTNENGLSYQDYLGIPEDPDTLGRFSTGQVVEDLQYRLRALGFFSDEISGSYRTSTINAVKQLQKVLGLDMNGYTSPELMDCIFSSDAPTAMEVSITEGMSGPIVRNLQTYLQTLCLYDGDIDGIYDVEVIKAVNVFQQIYGYTVEDAATPTLQKALYYESGKVSALFLDSDYTCEQTIVAAPLATISSSMRVRLRSAPSTESDALDKVDDGEQVLVLEPGSDWTKVQYGSNVGYIKNKYLVAVPWSLISVTYTGATTDQIYTIGVTLDSFRAGAQLPCVVFDDYLANEGSLEDYEGVADYATVNTSDEGVRLNLRAAPSTDGDVIAELENGTQLKVLLKSSEWTLVEYESGSGYLKNDFLDYWSGPEDYLGGNTDGLDDSELFIEDDYQEVVYATVQAMADGYAPVFDLDSEDANQIGALPADVQVTIVEADDAWSLIDFQGHQGYMHNESLKFILTEDVA